MSEDILIQILNKLDGLEKNMKELKTDVSELKVDVSELKAGQKRIEEKINNKELTYIVFKHDNQIKRIK